MATIRFFRHYIRVSFLLLGIIEAFIFVIAVFLGALLRFHDPGLAETYLPKGFLIAAVMITSMAAVGLYQPNLRERALGFVQRFAVAAALGVIGLAMIFYIFPNLFIGRGVLLFSTGIAFLGIALVRTLFYRYAQDMFRRRILVLGSGNRANSILDLRRSSDRRGFTIVGFVHVRGEEDLIPPERVIHLNMPLADFAIQNEIDEIVVAVDDRRRDFLPHELLDCRMAGIDVIELLTFFERETGKIRLDLLHPSWLIFSDGFTTGSLRDLTKRAFDILASSVIVAFTWPFMLLTTIAIKLEDGFDKPVLYRQIRIGQHGRPFHILKFRSMIVDAERGGKAVWAAKNDPRVTRVGRFIRMVRIDELPQIWNVLRGDMSFVGPRPERPQFVVELSDSIPFYAERHLVKPGITGWAQLLYPYGDSPKDAMEKLQYDLYYIKNHSMLLDFSILLQTVAIVLFRQGSR